jgi:tripartite-type tricarboxylate transporter receptor subunit TctC
MHYVYLTNNVVTDQCQIDPYSVFNGDYAEQFIEAPDEVTFGWSLIDREWVAPIVPQPTPEQIQAQNKAEAEQLLQATDWTATVDINNPQYSNPYLGNQDAFLAYRSQVRQIAVNPPVIPAVFPEKPQEVWVSV